MHFTKVIHLMLYGDKVRQNVTGKACYGDGVCVHCNKPNKLIQAIIQTFRYVQNLNGHTSEVVYGLLAILQTHTFRVCDV